MVAGRSAPRPGSPSLLTLVRDDPRAATSVRGPDEAVDVHVADSLTAPLRWLASRARARSRTSAAAPGFRGCRSAIARPGMEVDLVESQCAQVRIHGVPRRGASALEHVHVVDPRAEDWGARGEAMSATTRCLPGRSRRWPTLVEYAAPAARARRRADRVEGRARPRRGAGRSTRCGQRWASRRPGSSASTRIPGSRAHNLHLYEKVSRHAGRVPAPRRRWPASGLWPEKVRTRTIRTRHQGCPGRFGPEQSRGTSRRINGSAPN